MSPENFENISNFEGWGLNLLAYEKKSVCEPESNERGWRGWYTRVGCVGGVIAWVAWMPCLREWCGWRTYVVGMLLSLFLLKHYPEGKNVENLLSKQQKNDPNRSENWFKRRTWFEEQVFLCITWTNNARILNMSEPQCGQICRAMCNFVNISEYVWNITCLYKSEF